MRRHTMHLWIIPATSILMQAANVVDCPKKSLRAELEKAKPGETITFTGVCTGPVVIRTENLTP